MRNGVGLRPFGELRARDRRSGCSRRGVPSLPMVFIATTAGGRRTEIESPAASVRCARSRRSCSMAAASISRKSLSSVSPDFNCSQSISKVRGEALAVARVVIVTQNQQESGSRNRRRRRAVVPRRVPEPAYVHRSMSLEVAVMLQTTMNSGGPDGFPASCECDRYSLIVQARGARSAFGLQLKWFECIERVECDNSSMRRPWSWQPFADVVPIGSGTPGIRRSP